MIFSCLFHYVQAAQDCSSIAENIGDEDMCLRSLRMVKEDGYRDLANVYKDEEFRRLPKGARLAEIVPPPAK